MTVSVKLENSTVQLESYVGVGLLLLAWLLSTMSLWFFAFYNIPSDAPDWARRAQIACFGTNELGLPNAAGWMLLTLSPGMFFGAIFIALYTETVAVFRGLFFTSNGRALSFVLATAIFGESLWVGNSIYQRITDSKELAVALSNTVIPDSTLRGTTPAPDFKLVNQHGAIESLSSFRGKPVILTFVFAHCQAVCPALIKTVSAATEGKDADSVHAVFITLDPWRDTPGSLPQLAEKWGLGAQASILSGAPDEVNAVLDSYNVSRQRDIRNGDVAHPSIVHVIDNDGLLAYSFNGPSPNILRDALSRLTSWPLF